MMIQIVREFIVKQEFLGKFRLSYGPGGIWSNLFGRSSGFQGITILQDRDNPLRFLTVDLWRREADWDRALSEQMKEAAAVEQQVSSWIDSKTELGIFRNLTEATVRPHRKPKKSRS